MNTPMCTSLGVRKGAWVEEEDVLLRKCIQKFGEGKWHLVPARAGLNRCRKSCRLRWLNYLRPHIKRGDFSSDEVDLMLRLHKLLGNRWRNDSNNIVARGKISTVKWNTHFQKRALNIASHHHNEQQKIKNKCRGITKNEIIRPQPRNFSSTKKNVSYCCINKSMITNTLDKYEGNKETIRTSTSEKQTTDNEVQWWATLLENCNEIEEEAPTIMLHEEKLAPLNGGADCMLKGQSDGWDDFSLDIDIWNLLN